MRKTVLLSSDRGAGGAARTRAHGCGSSSSGSSPSSAGATTSQATANAAFCSSLDQLETATANVKSLDPKNTTVTQLTTAATQLGAAWTNVKASAKTRPASTPPRSPTPGTA